MLSQREGPRLEVTIYQLAGDEMLACNRSDGTGFELSWAGLHRDWMDATPGKFAYRCLPLTIANQLGFWVTNPVGFTALWLGSPDKVELTFDAAADVWKGWITDQFGHGILTWNTPFLFRTAPSGSRVLISGPPNYFTPDCQPLGALIETDWATMSFTMNWKIIRPNVAVRFERGEPIFQAIPLARNPCLDVEMGSFVYRRLEDDPGVSREYHEWSNARNEFHRLKAQNEVSADDWQKHYFRGVALDGSEARTSHHMKVRTPEVRFDTNAPPPVLVPAALPPEGGLQGGAAGAPLTLRVRRAGPDAARLEPAGQDGFLVFAPRDLDLAAAAGAVVMVPTGLELEPPPGFVLEVRPAGDEGVAGDPSARVLEDIVEPAGAISIRVRLLGGREAFTLRAAEPLARIVPRRREVMDSEWILEEATA